MQRWPTVHSSRNTTRGQKNVSSPIVTSDGQSEGNPGAISEPVEAALAAALERASMAGEWATVALLARELQARREARAGVVMLDSARKRRQ